MEKLILTPHAREIIVNNGANDGAVDLFSYAPDESSSHALGTLYVLGQRDTDSSNVGYIVSLIAALARREYYALGHSPTGEAQSTLSPREAFARTLRKANEVTEEFFRSGDVKLSVGIVAIAGSTIMVSKLGTFKILLARNDQVIDIMSNVALFAKDHSEKQKFSSVIHGSVQTGDRILAFMPTKAVTARERAMRGWLLKLQQDEFTEHIEKTGAKYTSFATAMIHIDMNQTSEQAIKPSPQPPELTTEPKEEMAPTLAWTPRQSPSTPQEEPETPRLIPAEFSLGTRRSPLARLLDRIQFVRLDRRGKIVTASVAIVVVMIGTFLARTLILTSPQERKDKQALQNIQNDIDTAREKVSQNQQGDVRKLLAQAITSLSNIKIDKNDAKNILASITSVLDDIDNAQDATPILLASPLPDTPNLVLAAWASASQEIWVSEKDIENAYSVMPLNDDGSRGAQLSLNDIAPNLLLGWKKNVIAISFESRTIARQVNGSMQSYTIPTQDAVLDAAEFNDNLYVLTDNAILKISDLDTEKPVTKQWLTHNEELAAGAARICVDANIWTMGTDGKLTTYYKGEQNAQTETSLALSGTWKIMNASDGLLAVASGDARRIYFVSPTDGSLVRTLKLDSDAPYTYISNGSNGSILLLTSEGKLWQVK